MKKIVLIGLLALIGCEKPNPSVKELTESEFERELTKLGICVKLADAANYEIDKTRFNIMFNSFNTLRHCNHPKVIGLSECSYNFSKNYKDSNSSESVFNSALSASCVGLVDQDFSSRSKSCIDTVVNRTKSTLPLIDENIKKIGGIPTKESAQEKYALSCFSIFNLEN